MALLVLFSNVLLFGQVSVSSGVSITGGVGINTTGVGLPSANAQLPLNWASSKESSMVSSFDVTKTLGSAGGSDYVCATGAACFASLQQAYCDWQFAADQNWKLVIAHGTLVQTGTSVTCTQTGATTYRSFTLNAKDVAAARPNKFFVIHSDTPLPVGQTPCAHATDDAGVRQPPTGDISTWWTAGNNGCSNDIGSTWTLEGNWTSGNTGMLIQAGAWINDGGAMIGPSHVIIADVELRPIKTNTGSVFLVNLSIDAAYTAPTLLSQMPSDIHFINYYAHGDATDWCDPGNPLGLASCSSSSGTGGPGNNKIAAVLHFTDCQNCSSTFFYIDYAISLGAEDHLIDAPRTNGPLKVAHGWLSGASNGFFLGGEAFDDLLYSIFDVQFTSNRVTMPISWVGRNYNSVSGLTLKNRLEFKNCIRCLIEGNYFENQDTSGGQDGQCIGLNPRSCSNSFQCNNYQTAVQDITIRKNVCRNSLVGLSNAAYSSYPSNGGGAGAPADRWTIEYNLLYGIGSAFYDSHKAVSFPYAFRTNVGGAAHICSGVNAVGVLTFTCDISVTGLQQVQIRVNDLVVITSCSDPTWNLPATGTAVWQTQEGTPAISGTTQAGATVVVNNPSAVAATATGCILQPMGGPYNQVIRHNTVIMQSDVYPSTCTGCASTKNLSGAASITGGLATVTISGTPVAVPNRAKINVVNSSIAAYNCNLCLVTAVSGSTITYQTASSNRVGDTITLGSVQQPPNNAAIYNGGGVVKFFTDTGCSGAGVNNSLPITAWSRTSGVVTAYLANITNPAWPTALVSPQIIVETTGSGSATGTFYYMGQVVGSNVAITAATDSGSTATITSTLNPGVGSTVVIVGETPAGYNGTWTVLTSSGANFTFSLSGVGPSTVNGTAHTVAISYSQPGVADEVGTTFGTASQMGTCSGNQFSQSNTFSDNLLAIDEGVAASCSAVPSSGWAGWINSGGANQEGCASGPSVSTCAENHLDFATSKVINTDFPGRCSQKYAEIGGAFAGAIPPHTLTFPPVTVCPGATVTLVGTPSQPSCVGMKTMMNGATFDANNIDPSQYVLSPNSLYKQGALFQASDGSDMGIGSFTIIQNANHSLQYVCPSNCGTGHGPYPD